VKAKRWPFRQLSQDIDSEVTVMKTLLTVIALLLLLGGCTNKTENSNGPAAPANQTASGNTEKPVKDGSPSATNAGEPVDFTCLGLSADKTHFSYRVKVNTDKGISQVDIEVKTVDQKGKASTQTYLWQNIVKSTRQPIEKGKTYDVDESVEEGTNRVECKIKRVVFADGTSWSPK